MDPGQTTVGVGSSATAFSFTWVDTTPAEHQHTFRLQWRLSSAGSSTMDAGDPDVLWLMFD
jgi:hypothetical protein